MIDVFVIHVDKGRHIVIRRCLMLFYLTNDGTCDARSASDDYSQVFLADLAQNHSSLDGRELYLPSRRPLGAFGEEPTHL